MDKISYGIKKQICCFIFCFFVSIFFRIFYRFFFESSPDYLSSLMFSFFFICIDMKYNILTKVTRKFVAPKKFSIFAPYDDPLYKRDSRRRCLIAQQFFSLFKEINLSGDDSRIFYFVLCKQNNRWVIKNIIQEFMSIEEFKSIFLDTQTSFNSIMPVNLVYPNPNDIASGDIKKRLQFFKNNPNVFYRKGKLCFEDVFSGEYYQIEENIFDKKTWEKLLERKAK